MENPNTMDSDLFDLNKNKDTIIGIRAIPVSKNPTIDKICKAMYVIKTLFKVYHRHHTYAEKIVIKMVIPVIKLVLIEIIVKIFRSTTGNDAQENILAWG